MLAGLVAFPLTGGCIYKVNIQQGNFLDKEKVAQVEVGMTRQQVRFLLGTPMVEDPFHANRWDYVYYLTVGRSRETTRRHFAVFFDGDAVTRVENL